MNSCAFFIPSSGGFRALKGRVSEGFPGVSGGFRQHIRLCAGHRAWGILEKYLLREGFPPSEQHPFIILKAFRRLQASRSS